MAANSSNSLAFHKIINRWQTHDGNWLLLRVKTEPESRYSVHVKAKEIELSQKLYRGKVQLEKQNHPEQDLVTYTLQEALLFIEQVHIHSGTLSVLKQRPLQAEIIVWRSPEYYLFYHRRNSWQVSISQELHPEFFDFLNYCYSNLEFATRREAYAYVKKLEAAFVKYQAESADSVII